MELTQLMMKADGGKMFQLDIYALGCIKRSLAHCKGFATLIATKNLTCAGAIVRMQLDTLLRFYAAFLVDRPHDFASDVLGGEPVKNIKDHRGNKMHDAYLVECLSIQHPWLKEVYKQTSGYVHFSAKHIFASMHSLDEENRMIYFQIGSDDVPRAEEFYQEAIDAFHRITVIFLDHIEGWVLTKSGHLTESAKTA